MHVSESERDHKVGEKRYRSPQMRISLSIVIQVWRRVFASPNCIIQQHNFTFSDPAQEQPSLTIPLNLYMFKFEAKKAHDLLT